MQAAELAKTKSRLKANGVKGVHVTLNSCEVINAKSTTQKLNTLLNEYLNGNQTPTGPVGKLTYSNAR